MAYILWGMTQRHALMQLAFFQFHERNKTYMILLNKSWLHPVAFSSPRSIIYVTKDETINS